MARTRWTPATKVTTKEAFLVKRLGRTKKLFAFLRAVRHELFDEAFQAELETMYRGTGAGKAPVPPAMMAMAVLLQAYAGISDAEAVELTVVDLRWQLVLDCLGADKPAFSQGALHDFRARLIRTNMDRRLLERTVEFARTRGDFDPKKLSKDLRVAMDSMPLEGAGRVEDTLNLLGHAAKKLVECAAALVGKPFRQVCVSAGIPVLLATSIKKGLDCEWSDPAQKADALQRLLEQLESLQLWIEKRLPEAINEPPLLEHVQLLRDLVAQDLEPDPNGPKGRRRIRQGVAAERRISITDPEMRHGRKSKSKRFNGYKRHIAADIDTKLILSCAVTPANRPEEEAAPDLEQDIQRQGLNIDELHIDRGYINASTVPLVLARGGQVLCKPWVARNSHAGLFTKSDFHVDMRRLTITCPAGQTERFTPGSTVEFDPETCGRCRLRDNCTMATSSGRTVSLAEDEQLQHRLRKLVATPTGRQELRQRVGIEHRLAHVSQRQGRRARYCGARINLFDLRRCCAIQNLETSQLADTVKAA
jgi:Transposase domain (DUF772)/Transposase DDE domain